MTLHRNKKKADLVTYIYDNRLDSDRNCGVGNLPKAPGLPLPAFPLSCLGYSVVGAYCMFGYTAVHEVRIRRIVFFPNPTLLISLYFTTQQCVKLTVHLSVGPQHGMRTELCYLLIWSGRRLVFVTMMCALFCYRDVVTIGGHRMPSQMSAEPALC